jgi:hypothetical protein
MNNNASAMATRTQEETGSPQQIEREGRRVLRKLSESGLFLAPEANGQYALAGSKRAGKMMRASAVVVEAFRARGWLNPRGTKPETFAISDAGSGWIARALAADDPFATQHRVFGSRLIQTPDGARAVAVNEAESPLARLRLRGLIDTTQYEAGERLRRDFTIAGLMPRLAADLTAPIAGTRGGAKSEPFVEKMIAAKQRFRLAMSAVGPGLSDLLFDVCCHLKGLESIESMNEWPTRSAKVVLQIALDRLASHYGMAMRAVRRSRLRSWQADIPV